MNPSGTKPWKVRRSIKCVYINDYPHEVWPITAGSLGMAVVVLPHEDSNRATRKERLATARSIAEAQNQLIKGKP